MKTELSDGRINVRRYRAEDIPLLFEAARESVNELHPWLPWCHANYSVEDSAAFVMGRDAEWDREEHYSFAVFDLATGDFLGGAGLNFVNRAHNFCNLGYWTRSSRSGRGIATAAAKLAARFGLSELKFQRIEILAAVGNVASQRVAGKTGALREGILRKRLLLYNKPHDAIMYSLTAENCSPDI